MDLSSDPLIRYVQGEVLGWRGLEIEAPRLHAQLREGADETTLIQRVAQSGAISREVALGVAAGLAAERDIRSCAEIYAAVGGMYLEEITEGTWWSPRSTWWRYGDLVFENMTTETFLEFAQWQVRRGMEAAAELYRAVAAEGPQTASLCIAAGDREAAAVAVLVTHRCNLLATTYDGGAEALVVGAVDDDREPAIPSFPSDASWAELLSEVADTLPPGVTALSGAEPSEDDDNDSPPEDRDSNGTDSVAILLRQASAILRRLLGPNDGSLGV